MTDEKSKLLRDGIKQEQQHRKEPNGSVKVRLNVPQKMKKAPGKLKVAVGRRKH